MAFNIALSGLNAVTGQLDQISNNIANSGSYGFKSGRANFASAYSQGKAGGVYVGSTTQSMSLGGNVLATGRSLDAAIQGRGFFVARDSNGAMVYSRVGQFNVDKDGFVVDSIGRRVQGYGTATGGVLGDLSVPTEAMPAAASTTLNYAGNMSADWQPPAGAFDMADATTYNGVQVSSLYDSLGRQHTLSQYFVRGAGNEVTVYYAVDGTLVDDGTGPVTSSLQFGTTGQLAAPAAPVSIGLGTPDGAEPLQVAINYATTTFFGGDFNTTTNRANGNAPGTVVDTTLAEDGSIQVQYSNGSRQEVGRLALAVFPSESGLTAVDGTSWQPNATTGEPIYGEAGSGVIGSLEVASLEASNVDMAAELVNLMNAQQGYQANSKVLTTESEMVRTLMQAL